MTTVTEPGLYPDMDEADYHRDPVPGGSLSSTGARKLLPPKTPAHYDHDRRNPPPSREDFDLGKAVHTRLLGAGSVTVIVDAKDWKTKAAREARDAAYAAGQVPLLAHQAEQVDAMVDAVRSHRLAAALLDPAAG
ncbi:hypothetical protein ACGFIG_09455 [Micromonospora sp. NPDC049048]|uniref:hypothetical protein n=1 Tax=Micromonospora sp. NPDC049048 TaxID=3364263 RepID=UPI0037199281